MKQICICGPFPKPIGGVSIHVKRLAFSLNGTFKVVIIDESPIIKDNIYNLRTFNLLKYISVIKSSDLVHVNSSVVVFRFFNVLFAFLFRKKIVITIHSFRNFNIFSTALNNICFRLSDVNIVVNAEIAKYVPCESVVIPAFISPSNTELELFDPFLSLVSSAKNRGRRIVVSNAYRLDMVGGREIYGFLDLLKLFSDVEINADYILILNVSSLAGCEEIYKTYEKFIIDNRLENCIYLFNEEMSFPALLKCSDLYIRATSTDGDALSIRESLKLGVRTIASDCVHRPKGTILYKDGDISSLKQAVLFGESIEIPEIVSFEHKILAIYKGLL